MTTSRLDAVYRSFLITKFFTKGWGQPENLRRLFEFRKRVSNRDECFKLVERNYPITITKEETSGDCMLVEGHFLSPLERLLPGIVPPVAQQAHFQAVIPLKWSQPDYRPMCLHLAGTGDHYFWRRRQLMVKPLLKEAGIGGIILENPFYGLRKPSDQVRSSLHNVSDIFVMGGCLILESLVLFHWCERNNLGPLGVTGLSMGGHMASLAATNWPKPLVLVPCLSWSTASAVFLQGVMSHSINWDLLEDQYLSDGIYREKLSKMVTVIDEPFLAGKKFAKKVTESVNISMKEISSMQQAEGENAQKKIDKGNCEKLVNHKENVTAEIQSGDKLKLKLENLSRSGEISRTLYKKLNSNEKFELDSKDIEELNKVNKDDKSGAVVDCGSGVQENKTSNTNELARDVMQDILTEVCAADRAKSETKKPMTLDKIAQEFVSIEKSVSTTGALSKMANSNDVTAKSNSDTTNSNSGEGESRKKSNSIGEMTSDILSVLPFVGKSSGRKIDIGKVHWRDREALQFMRGIMDECTHLSNFSVPFDTSLIIAVCAKHDAYVPRDDVGTLEEIWPGAEVRYVDAGHVSAYLLHQSMFRSCIVEAFERSKRKWKNGSHVA